MAALTPAVALSSRLVTLKNHLEPMAFLESARRKLAELGVSAEPALPLT